MTKALARAQYFLAQREHSAYELQRKLIQKGFDQEEVAVTLAECQRLGWQSDHRFVETVIRSRLRQGYGPLKIVQELKNKGITSDLIQEQLHQVEHDWFSGAEAVLRKKWGTQEASTPLELQKMQRFLLYRGFSMDIIKEII